MINYFEEKTSHDEYGTDFKVFNNCNNMNPYICVVNYEESLDIHTKNSYIKNHVFIGHTPHITRDRFKL